LVLLVLLEAAPLSIMDRNMNIEPFSLNVINKYNMFFMLQKLTASSTINLFHQQSQEDVPFENCALFEMANGQVLVAFPEYLTNIGKYNLIATDGAVSEIVNLQTFESIYNYYASDTDDQDSGVFAFIDSRPIELLGQDWRCDNSLYGPRLFYYIGQDETLLFDGIDRIKVYEPILNINGVGHLIYLKHGGDDTQIRYDFINDATLPQTAETFSEMVKLILEWAAVTELPFENTENVAQKAKQFVEKFGITERLVSGQPDMQVIKYLQGNASARLRTPGSYPLTQEQNEFIKRNIAHLCLSSIIYLYPDAADLIEVREVEQAKLAADLVILDSMRATLNNPDDKNMAYFLTSRTNLLTSKQSILESL
jgi:hypothetical protein